MLVALVVDFELLVYMDVLVVVVLVVLVVGSVGLVCCAVAVYCHLLFLFFYFLCCYVLALPSPLNNSVTAAAVRGT